MPSLVLCVVFRSFWICELSSLCHWVWLRPLWSWKAAAQVLAVWNCSKWVAHQKLWNCSWRRGKICGAVLQWSSLLFSYYLMRQCTENQDAASATHLLLQTHFHTHDNDQDSCHGEQSNGIRYMASRNRRREIHLGWGDGIPRDRRVPFNSIFNINGTMKKVHKSKMIEKLHTEPMEAVPDKYIALVDMGFLWRLLPRIVRSQTVRSSHGVIMPTDSSLSP